MDMNEKVSFDLTGKKALVTGGRRGIGLAIAKGLRDQGAEVTVTGTTADVETVEGFPLRQAKLQDNESIKAMAAEFESMDILINNAGNLYREGKEYDPELFPDIVDLNLNGTYRMCHAFYPLLKASKGCIVNVVSMRSFISSPLGPAYGAAKAGIMQLTRTLAVHWGKEGIRVNALAPGWIRTELNQSVQNNEEMEAEIAAESPFNRWGLPHEMAGAAVYLSSPAASFTTGTCVVADGGFLA
jgi:NAD(P)-dependent dehydrogenase (short-subunit alcohol dehydrogenase family)